MTSITTLLETMRMLRDKDNGCPWDIEQTLESLSPCVVEEAYEVADAIAKKDYNNLKEELGDVLLQVIFQAEIANELKLFNFDEIVDTLNKKLIRRHPHVFEDAPKPLSAQEQTQA
ncbi:nucleoside triphosphate pyrophosphohydrolase, partial [Gammaproteobacteria bacterium]|nr:nucleoside triphosphate pyrophosphohydrolase [Gammaproteobacteria bacterium]